VECWRKTVPLGRQAEKVRIYAIRAYTKTSALYSCTKMAKMLTCNARQSSRHHGSQVNHRQATTSVECCRPSRHWHQEVRPWTLATDAPCRSYTGSTSLSESVTSYWLTGVCSAKRQCTCPTVVSRSPKSQHVGIYTVCMLHVISWPFRDIVSTLTVVGHSPSLVRWRSKLCQLICETPQLSDNCWKHTFSLPISTFSALGVSHVMRYINLRYLLTYL